MKTSKQKFCFAGQAGLNRKIFLTIICIVFSCYARGQLLETFSDGEITSNPPWSGNVADFTVASETLRLTAPPVAGTSAIVTPQGSAANTSWEFSVRLLFNPSGSNYAQVYLATDAPDVNGPANGYVVQIGSADDDVCLFRQSGTTRTKLIDGADGRLNLAEVNVRIRVVCSADNEWTLFSKHSAENEETLEGSAIDAPAGPSSYFAIVAVYTATRSDKFYFDDIVVSPGPASDRTSPDLAGITVAGDTGLRLTFTEGLDPETASLPSMYTVNRSVGEPLEIAFADEYRVVILRFHNRFPNGDTCTLTLGPLADTAGNIIRIHQFSFLFLQAALPEPYDVVINEILADPAPPLGLPECEYVELFNRSGKTFLLTGWTLSDQTSAGEVPPLILKPLEYLVLCAPANAPFLAAFGRTAAVAGFPSLNNLADDLILRAGPGQTIDSLRYTADWHRSAENREGGVSLERIDAGNICGEESNWASSEAAAGGTPGTGNSLVAENPDLIPPVLINAIAIRSDSVVLTFNERMSASNGPLAFALSGDAAVVSTKMSGGRAIGLRISPPLKAGTAYVLTGSVSDCAGNPTSIASALALAEKADSLDVVVNEILFNPYHGGDDFIELFNTSERYLDLSGWRWALLKDGAVADARVISAATLHLPPRSYHVFTARPETVKTFYPHAPAAAILASPVPPLNDDEGHLLLLDEQGRIMDHVYFHEDFHSPFVRNPEGVSLERLSSGAPSLLAENWKSASATIGFATPGLRNSNDVPLAGNETIAVNPEVFIPGTGQPGLTRIEYALDVAGVVASVRVLDARGRIIRTLASGLLLGTEGFLVWEGECDDGSPAPAGAYMVHLEMVSPGDRKVYRRRVVVAPRS